MGVPGDEHLGCPRSQPYPMPGLALSPGIQHIREQMGDSRYRVAIGPQARNSVPDGGRPACYGNNNCMPMCPVDAMYHGGIGIDRAREAEERALANSSDMVGRNLMDHPGSGAGRCARPA